MAIKQICVLVAFFILAADALRWKNCDGSSPVQIREVNLSPDPIRLKAGTKVSFSAKFQVKGDTGSKYRLKLKVQKKAWFWITIPCINGIGSCTITHLKLPNKNLELSCDAMKVLINEKVCPLPHKVHEIPRKEVVLPKIPLPSFLTSGNYFVRADLTDRSSNRKIACVEVYAKVA